MKNLRNIYVGVNFLLFASISGAQSYFNDSDPVTMILGDSTYYEIGLRKLNGSITYIIDKTSGDTVCLGSSDHGLWRAEFRDSIFPYCVANNYSNTSPDTFTYSWSQGAQTLTLNYIPNPTAEKRLTVTVSIIASGDCYFDIKMVALNEWGSVLTKLGFDIRLPKADIVEGLLPLRPGTIVYNSFFISDSVSFLNMNPARFSDLYSLKIKNGSITCYTLWETGPIRPVWSGFYQITPPSSDAVFFTHHYLTWVENGELWTSSTARIRMAQTFWQSVLSYRTDNGIDTFPSLQEKLGNKFETVIRSPLLHTDPCQLFSTAYPFKDWPQLFRLLPSPGILMLSNYWPGGFHGHHPDVLPPDSLYGTLEELSAAMDSAHALGFLVMPFTLPIWWHENSPTINNLTCPLSDIAVIGWNGQVDYFCFDANNYGYGVSPNAPYVKQRLDELMQQLKDTLSADMVYEDCIGAFEWKYDLNLNDTTYLDHSEYWLEHTRTYKNYLLVTEVGYDRLLETEVGFLGSMHSDWDFLNYDPGTSDWRLFPFTILLGHDKVLFYQYWADPSIYKENLCWNLAFGYMLNNWLMYYDFVAGEGYEPMSSPWTNAVAQFQAQVASRYAGKELTDFQEISNGITQTTFEDITIIRNWSKSLPYSVGNHIIPSEGAIVTSSNSDLIAGVFTVFNNDSLATGIFDDDTLPSNEHFMIIESLSDSIIIWHPIGVDTRLKIERPPGWTDTVGIRVYAVGESTIVEVPDSVDNNYIIFSWNRVVSNDTIMYYKICYSLISAEQYEPYLYFRLQPYPNPFSETTTLEIKNGKKQYYDLKIYDLFGREVRKYEIRNQKTEILRNNLSSGMYFYQVKDKEQIIGTGKLIVQ